MADPLTALIHAVQVMNFLKTLIIKTLRERPNYPCEMTSLPSQDHTLIEDQSHESLAAGDNLLRSSSDYNNDNSLGIMRSTKSDVSMRKRRTLGHTFKDEYQQYMEAQGILNRLSLRKGMQKLCRHPLFQLKTRAPQQRSPSY